MGAARRVLDGRFIPLEQDRQRTRARLEKAIQRTSERLKTNRTDGVTNRAYALALIRLNEFLVRERILQVSDGRI